MITSVLTPFDDASIQIAGSLISYEYLTDLVYRLFLDISYVRLASNLSQPDRRISR